MTTPTEPSADERTLATLRALDAARRLTLHPDTPPLWNWEINTPGSQKTDLRFGDATALLNLPITTDDRDATALALLGKVAEIHGGRLDVDPPDQSRRYARAVLDIDGVRVVLWDAIAADADAVTCGRCGVIGARVYADVSDGTKACPDCADEIIREEHDQEHGEPTAAKASLGADEGATEAEVTLEQIADALDTVDADPDDFPAPLEQDQAWCDPAVRAAVAEAVAAASCCGLGDPRACGHCDGCDTCNECGKCAGRGCTCACPRAGGAA